ncbi:MAG: M48 family metallopeptidase [Actinomycetota bacterium]|nr:M48 family metallopeptidase [Actinomycetota bacterium]
MKTLISWLKQSAPTATFALVVGSGTVAAIQLVSVEDEIKLGRDAQQAIRKEMPEVRDTAVRGYVSSLGERLSAHASGADYPYSFSTADYRELNAFALPGGPVWINRGILSAAKNESQVAGVLAHEIAHVARRHSAQQLTKGTVANGLMGLLGAFIGDRGGAGAAAAQVAAGVTANSFMLKFSRDDEREADREGVQILQRAGYDPRGVLEFMQILAAQQGRSPGAVAQFLSTHPAPASRVQELQQLVGAAGGGRRNSEAFSSMKQRLERLPAAPSMARTR